MTPQFLEFPELRGLLDALSEESITPEQVQRLEQLVLNHPETEAFYVQYMSFQADLISRLGVLPARVEQSLRDRVEGAKQDKGAAKQPNPEQQPSRTSLFWSPKILGPLVVLAAGILLAALLWPRWPVNPTHPRHKNEAGDDTVAILLRAPGAEWGGNRPSTRAGVPLRPGWLHLKSGYAQVEFYSGATVILEGPADFQLISRTEAYCSRGKLWATVPPQAHGFTIGSPQMDVVDRGTEFGIQVSEGGRTEVHVFQGQVDLYDPGADRDAPANKALKTGQGARLTTEEPGKVRPIASNPAAFLSPQQLSARLQAETERRHREWLDMYEELRQDQKLLVYFPFQGEQPWSRILQDQAKGPPVPHDGTVVACSWDTGRWAGKKSLEFKQVSDRVRLHVPGVYDTLTLMVWVRVDALPNRFNSLFMTDSWDDGEPHWHISESGKVELGVQGYGRKGGAHYYTPVIFTPDQLGQWVHLAVVYDRIGDQVTQYVNGKQVAQEKLQVDIALQIGNAEIGNWNVTDRRHNHPIRYFTGGLDEFLLFARPLDPQEIERHYTKGRPPSLEEGK